MTHNPDPTAENRMPPPGARVMVAMSGGVDSSAAARLLLQAGCHCLGATLVMGDEPTAVSAAPDGDSSAARDARNICEGLGIEHKAAHIHEKFDRHVIAPFAAAYAAGRTPNPCVRCNRVIKFGLLFHYARRWGCEYMATGHYVRLTERNGRMALRRGAHKPKDQSYVLAPLTQQQLRRACFPLGDMTKDAAREIAVTLDPALGEKAESQEICFVADRQYARLVEARHGPDAPGPIVDMKGNVLGQHKGIYHYTIGQRRGLGIGAEQPLYVVRLDKENNTIIVGRNEESLCGKFTTGRLHYGALSPKVRTFDALVQLRYRHVPVPGHIVTEGRTTHVTLHTPQQAVTPGQWAVFYDADGCVLAAGEIQTFETG